MHTVGPGKSEANGESGLDMCARPYANCMAGGKLLDGTGSPA